MIYSVHSLDPSTHARMRLMVAPDSAKLQTGSKPLRMFSLQKTRKGTWPATIARALQSQYTHRQQHLPALVFYPKSPPNDEAEAPPLQRRQPAPTEIMLQATLSSLKLPLWRDSGSFFPRRGGLKTSKQ